MLPASKPIPYLFKKFHFIFSLVISSKNTLYQNIDIIINSHIREIGSVLIIMVQNIVFAMLLYPIY
jgi:hypothetical protein